jgi:hypothetical protein
MATKAASVRDKVLARLRNDENGLRSRGAAMVVDTLFARPVAELVDGDEVARLVIEALTAPNATRLVQRHVHPGRARWTAHVKQTGELPKDFVSAATLAKLEALTVSAKLPKGAWANDAVDATLVRQLLAPVLQDTLVNFASRLPLPGMGGHAPEPEPKRSTSSTLGFLGSRMKAEVEKRAGGLVDVGRSIVGGLSAEVESRMQQLARDFSMSAQTDMRSAFEARLKSDEGKAIVAKLRAQIFRKAISTPLHVFDADTQRLPWDDLLALAGEIAEHNAARPVVRAWIADEVKALLAIEAGRTLGELLEEAGLAATARAMLVPRVDTHAAQVVASDAFAEWLGDLVG